MVNFEANEPVVILGFGQMGQVQLLLCRNNLRFSLAEVLKL